MAKTPAPSEVTFITRATCSLVGLRAYSMSKKHEEPKLPGEGDDGYAKRTWMSFAHVRSDGHITISPIALKNALVDAAAYMKIKIPNARGAMWKQKFERGIMCESEGVCDQTVKDLRMEPVYANADGVRGSGKRVWRYYPILDNWSATATYIIVDPIITGDVFERHMKAMGLFCGLGRFRVAKGGTYGTFRVRNVEFEQIEI